MPNRGSEIDTFGWDLISAVRIADLNKAIAAAGTTPPGFDAVLDEDGTRVTVTGTFDAWTLTTGGDGAIIHMQAPVRDVRIEADQEQAVFEHGEAEIIAHLELLPTDIRDEAGGMQQLLVLAEPTRDRPIAIHNAAVVGGGITDNMRFGAALDQWLNRNVSKFTHVFAAVSLHNVLDDMSDFPWLEPTSVAYAVGRNRETPESSILAVLAQTMGRPVGELTFQVMSDLIPTADSAAFVIARDRVMEDMLMKGLPKAFQGLSLNDLEVDTKTGVIRLIPGRMPHLSDLEHDGETYEVDLETFEIRFHANDIEVISHTRTKIAAGAYSVCEATGTYVFDTHIDEDGMPALGLRAVSEETEFRNVLDKNRKDKKNIISVIMAVMAVLSVAVLGLVYIGLAALAAVLCGCLMLGAAILGADLAWMKWEEYFGRKKAARLDPMLLNATMNIRWSSAANFVPSAVDMHGALRIAGSYQPGPDPHIDTLRSPEPDAAAFQAQFAEIMAKRAA